MKNTTRLIDLLNRSLTGPLMEEEVFNRQVTQAIRRAVREYQIRIHPEHIINQDDELADRTWQAALDFLAACGVYSQSTGRVILYSQKELLSGLSSAPDQVWLGSGTDAVLERYRKVDDPLGTDQYGQPDRIAYPGRAVHPADAKLYPGTAGGCDLPCQPDDRSRAGNSRRFAARNPGSLGRGGFDAYRVQRVQADRGWPGPD